MKRDETVYGQISKLRMQITLSLVALVAVMGIIGTAFCSTALAAEPGGQEATQASTEQKGSQNWGYGLVAAAVAFGLGAIGAGIAISHVGAAAVGAIAEKPQIAGQALIFVALAEGLVVFGFITALMILGKI